MTDSRDDTFPKLLLRNWRRYGSAKIAFRHKDKGIWVSRTWEDLYRTVEALALGLMTLGVNRGDIVGFIGDNSPEYWCGVLAVEALGGVTTGIYQDSLVTEVEYILNHSGAQFVFVEDQEQADKILELKDGLARIRRVIVNDWSGMKTYAEKLLVRLRDVIKEGDKTRVTAGDLFEKLISQGEGDDIALISYTSGTTGTPKGAVLSYNNLLNMAKSLETVLPMDESDRVITYLPLAWIAEIVFSVCFYLKTGMTIHFPESVATVRDNIREVGPTVILAAPRIWENMCSEVQVKIMDTSWLKRHVYSVCLQIGYKCLDVKDKRGKLGLLDRILSMIAFIALHRALQDKLGLRYLRHAFTGGSALGPDVFRFYQSFGVKIKQMYGQTEMAGFICTHSDEDVDHLTVGRVIAGVDLKIGSDGEILAKGPGLFCGYYNNPEATRESIDEDGFFHTGDFGYMRDNDGHVVVVDRMKDVVRLSCGERFSPTFIENRLKFSPYIREAVVVGEGRAHAAALIQIDYPVVGAWAEKRRIAYTTFQDLVKKKEVNELVAHEVEATNKTLPEKSGILAFRLLEKELDADDAELTRTQKLRRRFVLEKYDAIISQLYREEGRRVWT